MVTKRSIQTFGLLAYFSELELIEKEIGIPTECKYINMVSQHINLLLFFFFDFLFLYKREKVKERPSIFRSRNYEFSSFNVA